MSKAILINGDNGQLEDWSQVNWRKARQVVKNLRCRIYRARKLGQWKQLRRLQKLLIRSLSNLLLSVRQITQVNTGKQTAGIDVFTGKVMDAVLQCMGIPRQVPGDS